MTEFRLATPHTNVPIAQRPVYWDLDLPVQTNIHVLDRWMGYYKGRLPHNSFIDEAAIMVPSPWHAGRLDGKMRVSGWEPFNTARDMVYTSPFGTRYCVEYAFYRHPSLPYRLEVMMMVEDVAGVTGFSPLHASLWPNGKAPQDPAWHLLPIPHLSFKPELPKHAEVLSGEALLKQKRRSYSRAVQHLKDHACLHAQTCQSTYGAFGYYIGNDATCQIYLKPRVNLRDEEVKA